MVSNSTSYEWNIVTFFRAYHPAGQILQRPLPHWLNLKTILFSNYNGVVYNFPLLVEHEKFATTYYGKGNDSDHRLSHRHILDLWRTQGLTSTMQDLKHE